jgi:tryptophan halogenase
MKKSIDQNYNFLIIGGGSAGWISALFVRANFPDANITVIQSSEIGILGAGEGTTPHIIDYLDEVDIPVSELIKNCKATIKNGIKFSNWNGDRDFYYHPFPDNFDLDHTLISELQHTKYPLMDLEVIANNGSMNDIDFNVIASQRNCVRFTANSDASYKDLDPILHFTRLGRIALHFDANLLAQYLEKVGRTRNITVLDCKITDMIFSEQGDISAVSTEMGHVPCDFVFDCSGFQRLVIGKKFNTAWKSYKEYLPAKRAMPFFVQNDSNIIPPYTDSTAMKYGWMWKIPVQGRHGCGYVFDSDRITDDQAKEEIDKELGFEVTVPRTINFEPGRYEKIYKKNCIAIGLSAGFIEPLEATSIWTSIMMLRSWLENIGAITHNTQSCRDNVNKRFQNMNDNTLGFVYFHYITQRSDTDFWKNFTQDNKIPESLQTLIDESKYSIPSYDMFSNIGLDFAAKSFLACGSGQRFFNLDHAKKLFDSFYTGKRKMDYDAMKYRYIKNINLNLSSLIDHYSFIEYMKAN